MTTRRVSCVSASTGTANHVVVTALIDGRLEQHEMTPFVAAELIRTVADVLGSSALYNAGLERAAQLAEEWSDDSVPKRIRAAKIGRKL